MNAEMIGLAHAFMHTHVYHLQIDRQTLVNGRGVPPFRGPVGGLALLLRYPASCRLIVSRTVLLSNPCREGTGLPEKSGDSAILQTAFDKKKDAGNLWHRCRSCRAWLVTATARPA